MALNKEYTFLALVHNKGELGYLINFQDIDECFTYCNDINEGLVLAKEALEYCIHGRQEHGDKIPEASNIEEIIKISEDDIIVPVTAKMRDFREDISENPIDRDVHIPAWLESIANTNKEKLKDSMDDIIKEIEKSLV